MRVYLSGPMRGIPEYNFPAFDHAAAWLRRRGYEVISPAEHDRQVDPEYATRSGYATGAHEDGADGGPSFQQLIGWDLHQIAKPGNIGAIILMSGWENSTGAGMELEVARWTGKRVGYLQGTVSDGKRWIEYRLMWEDTMKRPWRQPPSTLIVGLSGYARAGKDTFAAGMTGFQRVSFADKLKAVLADIDPHLETDAICDDLDGKDVRCMTLPLSAWRAMGADDVWLKKNTDYRIYCQDLGTSVREHLGELTWVNAALDGLAPGGRYVITDVRYPNEAQAIKDRGGEVWRINRFEHGPANEHISETGLDDWPFDQIVFNTGQDIEMFQALAAGLSQRVGLGQS